MQSNLQKKKFKVLCKQSAHRCQVEDWCHQPVLYAQPLCLKPCPRRRQVQQHKLGPQVKLSPHRSVNWVYMLSLRSIWQPHSNVHATFYTHQWCLNLSCSAVQPTCANTESKAGFLVLNIDNKTIAIVLCNVYDIAHWHGCHWKHHEIVLKSTWFKLELWSQT